MGFWEEVGREDGGFNWYFGLPYFIGLGLLIGPFQRLVWGPFIGFGLNSFLNFLRKALLGWRRYMAKVAFSTIEVNSYELMRRPITFAKMTDSTIRYIKDDTIIKSKRENLKELVNFNFKYPYIVFKIMIIIDRTSGLNRDVLALLIGF